MNCKLKKLFNFILNLFQETASCHRRADMSWGERREALPGDVGPILQKPDALPSTVWFPGAFL